MDAILARNHGDRHSLINNLIRDWVLDNLDDEELLEPVTEIFANQL